MNKSREENRRDCMRVTAFNRIFHNPPAYPHWMSVTMPSMAISDETRCYAIHGASSAVAGSLVIVCSLAESTTGKRAG